MAGIDSNLRDSGNNYTEMAQQVLPPRPFSNSKIHVTQKAPLLQQPQQHVFSQQQLVYSTIPTEGNLEHLLDQSYTGQPKQQY